MSFLKSLGKELKKAVTNPLYPFTRPLEALSDGARDFKNWYDGTDAQRKQNDINRQNWELENAYNSPAAQMERYKAAGLNPNLIYSQQNLGGSIGNVSPTMSGAEMIGKGIGAISTALGIKNMSLQNSMLTNQSDYVKEQARRMRWDNDWLESNGLSSFSPSLERNYSFGERVWNSWRDFARDVGDMVTGSSLRASRRNVNRLRARGDKAERDWQREQILDAAYGRYWR